MQHTLYLNRLRVFFSSLLELLPLLGLVVIGPNERVRAGGWCGIGVTIPPASTVSTACLHTSNMSRPCIPTTPYTRLSRRPHASSKRDQTQLQIEQQIRKNRIVENNKKSHELGYEFWIQFFFFGPNFFFFFWIKA